MRSVLMVAGVVAAMGAAGGPGAGAPPAKTKTFREVTGELRDLRSSRVKDAKVKKYLESLQFDPADQGSVAEIPECATCAETVTLEIVAEHDTRGLDDTDLGSEGRLVARIRNVDTRGRVQKDLKLSPGQTAYIWLQGKSAGNRIYHAWELRVDDSGKRYASVVHGRVWRCAHSAGDMPSGGATWHPTHECNEPGKRPSKQKPGRARTRTYHLTSWFPCDAGCCVFQDY